MPTHTTGSNFEPGPSACRSANLIERRLGERRNSLRDEMGSFIVCENIGVENHMVEQRVSDILLEIISNAENYSENSLRTKAPEHHSPSYSLAAMAAPGRDLGWVE